MLSQHCFCNFIADEAAAAAALASQKEAGGPGGVAGQQAFLGGSQGSNAQDPLAIEVSVHNRVPIMHLVETYKLGINCHQSMNTLYLERYLVVVGLIITTQIASLPFLETRSSWMATLRRRTRRCTRFLGNIVNIIGKYSKMYCGINFFTTCLTSLLTDAGCNFS